jgi:hypothetical protein
LPRQTWDQDAPTYASHIAGIIVVNHQD